VEIEFTTRAWTLGEILDVQRATNGDVEAWVRVLVARSNLTEEEVLNLTPADLAELTPKLAEATDRAVRLMGLSKQMGKAGS